MARRSIVIELFYDIISPYSYLAFEVLHRYKPIWNIDLKLKPMLLGGVMKSSGNKPPAVVPNKGIYMAQDLRRLQKYFQVPLNVPENMMDLIMRGGSLNAQRFLTAVEMLQPENLENISRAMYKRLFVLNKDISSTASFREAGESIDMQKEDLEKSLSMISDEQVKKNLRQHTDDALEYGAFGAPMIVVHVNNKPEVFFGSDRFEILAHVIGKEWSGPVPDENVSKL